MLVFLCYPHISRSSFICFSISSSIYFVSSSSSLAWVCCPSSLTRVYQRLPPISTSASHFPPPPPTWLHSAQQSSPISLSLTLSFILTFSQVSPISPFLNLALTLSSPRSFFLTQSVHLLISRSPNLTFYLPPLNRSISQYIHLPHSLSFSLSTCQW